MKERLSVVHLTSPPSGTSLPASSRSSVLFPSAVVADHPEALPGGDSERDAVEHGAVAESLAQIARTKMRHPE